MDVRRIYAALDGDLPISELSLAERHAFAHEVVRAEVRAALPQEKLPVRFLLPPVIEAMYRGRSS